MNRLSAGCEAGRDSWTNLESTVFLRSVSNTGEEHGTIFRQAYWHLVYLLLQWLASISNSAVSSVSPLFRRVKGVTQSCADRLCRTAQHANNAYIMCKSTVGLPCLQRRLPVAATLVGLLASSDAAPQASETPAIKTTPASDLLECKSVARKTSCFSSWRVVPVNFAGILDSTIRLLSPGASHDLIHVQHAVAAQSTPSCFATQHFTQLYALDYGAQYAVTDFYLPVAGLRSIQFKISGREPEDLPTHFTEWLCALACACGCVLSAVYIRKGCIELTLDIENADMDLARQEGEAGQLEERTPGVKVPLSAVPTLPSAAVASGVSDEGTTGDRDAATTISPKAMQGQQHQQLRQQQRGVMRIGGDSGNQLGLGSTDGVLALAHRVRDALGGGDGSGGMAGVSSRAAPIRRPSGERDVHGASDLTTGTAVPTPPQQQQQQQPASVVRTIALWQSSFVPPSSYPAISRVHPRVVVVQAGRQVPAHRHGFSSTSGWNSSAAGVGAASAGAPMATMHLGGMAAAAAASSHELRRESLRPITLLVEISGPRDVRLSALAGAVVAPAMASNPVSANTDSTGASPAMPASVASVPGDTPAIELLVRCSGRYIPIDVSLAPSQMGVASGNCDGGASAPDVECINGGGGGSSNTGIVRRSYRITLLEPPVVTGGVMLVDLRWQGRPAQVVPVVLLDEPDEQLQVELSAVAATWTGPPYELDGLLYDLGAWLRCMAVRRAARTATQAVLGVERSSTQAQSRGRGPAMSAAVASGSGFGPAARGEPPFLPVLGASLLQFAHAHGLIAMAGRLQADMRDCGYTAPFRITNMHRIPAAVEAEAAVAAAASNGNSPPEATGQMPSVLLEQQCGMDVAARTRTTPTRNVAEVGMAPSSPSATASGAANCVLAPESPSPVATLGPVNLHAMQRPPPAAGTVATVGQWRFVWEVVSLPPCVQRRRGSGPMLVEQESYLTFAEPHGAAVYCLFHLLDMLGLLELLIHLALTTHQQRDDSSIPAGAAVDTNRDGGGGGGYAAAAAALPHGALMLLVVLTSLPAIVNFSLQLLLPATARRRVAPHAKLVWHACLVARRLVLLWGGLPSTYPRLQQSYDLGPGVLVMEGMVVPAACLLSPWAALLLAAVKLPLYVIVGHASAIGKAADVATAATTAEVCMSRGHCVATALGRRDGYVGGGGALLAESVFRALAATTMALITTLACHVSLRMRTRKLGQVDAGKSVGRADGVQAEGKMVVAAAAEGVAAARTGF
ncbi:hypothetical protein Vafri_1377 [Volvox africanus]|nr:hypothetical protein Vafri_1377 [Volvox africanus]